MAASKKQNLESQSTLSFTSDNYLTRNYILEYLSDALEQLLECKSRSLNKQDVLEFFTQYFKNVKNGIHVMYREYKFIMLTPYNRACFIQNFYQAYNNLNEKDEAFNARDYHALIVLICNDFPFSVIRNCTRIITYDKNADDVYSFKDFIHALKILLYYDEFIREALKVFNTLRHQENRNQSDDNSESFEVLSKKVYHACDSVKSKQFYELIELLCLKFSYSVPPLNVLREILLKANTIKFFEFLNQLSASETVNNVIGKLPSKEVLRERYQNDKLNRTRLINPIQLIKEPQIQAIAKSESSLSKPTQSSLDYTSNQPEKLRRSVTKEQIVLPPPQKSKPKFYLNKEDTSSTTSDSSSDSDTYT